MTTTRYVDHARKSLLALIPKDPREIAEGRLRELSPLIDYWFDKFLSEELNAGTLRRREAGRATFWSRVAVKKDQPGDTTPSLPFPTEGE